MGNHHGTRIVQLGMTRTFGRLIPFLAAAVLAVGCAGGDDSADSSAGSYEEPMAEEAAAYDDAYSYDEQTSAKNAVAEDRDLIITIGIGLESSDIARTVAVLETAVTAANGLISSSEVGYGDATASEGWATMVVRIPPEAVDRFVEDLDAPATAATVASITRSALDVTDQVIELDVRIENQRESVEAIRRLMVDAVDLGDVVMLERELNQRQTELEVMLAQQASLTDRVDMATITIDIYQPGSAPEPESGILDGFSNGWSAFVSAASRIAYLLAAASPFLGVFALIGLGLIAIRRMR